MREHPACAHCHKSHRFELPVCAFFDLTILSNRGNTVLVVNTTWQTRCMNVCSESAKRVGRAALAAAVSVVSMGGALVKDATASVMSSYPVTRSIAGMLGLPTRPLVSPTTTTTTIVVSGGSGVSPSTGASHPSPGGGASMPAPSYASEPQYTPPGMDSYLVRCPTCNQVLAAPPGAPLFRCVCGTTLSR